MPQRAFGRERPVADRHQRVRVAQHVDEFEVRFDVAARRFRPYRLERAGAMLWSPFAGVHIVEATKEFPVMVRVYEERDGKAFALEFVEFQVVVGPAAQGDHSGAPIMPGRGAWGLFQPGETQVGVDDLGLGVFVRGQLTATGDGR